MSERLTVVFEDDALYRRLKVRAAEAGVPMKRLIEEAVRGYLGPDPAAGLKPFDWDAFDNLMQEIEEEAVREPHPPFVDLSDIKRHLYGWPWPPGTIGVAEERAPYNAGNDGDSR